MSSHSIAVKVNGATVARTVEARLTLADYLRRDAGMTGVHIGCEHGVCGACTVIVDGKAVRSCLMLAVQADGSEVTTLEGLGGADGSMHPVQQAMHEEYALQCGFCTPGVCMTLAALAGEGGQADEETLKDALTGHLCRCTGYQGMMRAAARLAKQPEGETA
jgi:carbon-monoxide dehydrogenase small subunit